jgi:glycerol kinase
MDLLLALDAGTTGVRAVAFDGEGTEVTSAYRALTQHFPAPGLVEHDALEIARLAVEVLREVGDVASQHRHRVVALGITNQRETTVAFDRARGVVSHHALVWQDRRTAEQCADLTARGALPEVRATTGLVLDPYFSGTKMRWLAEHGALDGLEQPAMATVETFLLWTLTGGPDGGVFATEPSNASRTMLLDLATVDWSASMTTLLGVDRAWLAPVRPSATHFGDVAASVVPELAGVPIAGILGDQQSALFGQACLEPGMVKATYGTGAFVLAHAGDRPPPPPPGLLATVAWDLGALGPVGYALEGSAFVAGAAIQWLRDELGLLAASSDLEPLARTVPDSGGVVLVPAFTGLGSPWWRSDATGVLMGLTRGSGRGQIARAVVEALAFQVRAMTDAFAAAGVPLRALRADGGAAVMDLLLELQATNSRLPVTRAASLEATARGAATLAGLTTGFYPDLAAVAATWRGAATFTPGDPAVVDAGYAAWSRAVERTT